MSAATFEPIVDDVKLRRSIDWRGAFWVATGVPVLVLFSIGGMAGIAGKLAYLIWTLSMLMGFVQSFTYAEIAGLFPNKSGGASVYGATAWLPYSKLIAPLSVWCNWVAWSPVLSLGCSIAAAYVLNAIAPTSLFTETSPAVIAWIAGHHGATAADAVAAVTAAATPGIRSWTLYAHAIGSVSFSLNANFFLGAALMLATFAIQHRGILGASRVQMYIGILVIVPMLIVGIAPLLTGKVDWANFLPLRPPAAANKSEVGAWNIAGWTLALGGMFIAAWSTYGFETAICYTSEFKDPKRDTFRAIFYSGLLCMVLYILVPFAFQGALGLDGMLAGPIVDGSGVANALASMVGSGRVVHGVFVFLMILALILCIMTAMAGSSRTLYQGSVDGWLPRYLSHVNKHGAPTHAMWSDLVFNFILLAIACSDSVSFFFILAVSNCCYIIFNFLNLNAGWIHRIDNGTIERPWRAPRWILVAGTTLAFVNALFMGAGAKVWSPVALPAGAITAAAIIPVFWFRHYVQDGGRFPDHLGDDQKSTRRNAGWLPYVTLLAGLATVLLADRLFRL